MSAVIVPLGYEEKLLDRKKALEPRGLAFSFSKGSVCFPKYLFSPNNFREKEKKKSLNFVLINCKPLLILTPLLFLIPESQFPVPPVK